MIDFGFVLPPGLVMTRGERNCNAMNLDFMATRAWNGQIGIEIIPDGYAETPRFGRYASGLLGLRAGAKQMIVDQNKYGANTIQGIVNIWAPRRDNNDPLTYAETVASIAKMPVDSVIDLAQLDTLLCILPGFIHVENGRCLYSPDVIGAACRAALGLPDPIVSVNRLTPGVSS